MNDTFSGLQWHVATKPQKAILFVRRHIVPVFVLIGLAIIIICQIYFAHETPNY